MKKTILFLSVFALTINFSFAKEEYAEYNKASFFTEKRDTLFLIDDPLGYNIKKIWENIDKKEVKPIIIFKNSIWIEEKHKALKYEKVN